MVEAEGVGGDPRVPIGATKDIAVINVVEATGDISDELQVALSDRGFDLLTTAKDNTVPNPSGAPMNTGNQTWKRLRIIEIVQI